MTTKEQNVLADENQSSLNTKIQEILFATVRSRKEEYESGRRQAIDTAGISNLITATSNKNAAISATVGLIPGPWGMAAAIPEIVMIIRNQMTMIYDIGMAHGKSVKELTPELILGVFVSSTGSATVGILTMHGSKVLVKRSSLRVIQKVITILGGRVTQQVAKSAVAKWLPFVGAVAMAAWSRISTKNLGNKALDIFSKEIVFEEGHIDNTIVVDDAHYTAENTKNHNHLPEMYEREKIKTFINLIKIDGKLDEKEIECMSDIINDSNINEIEKTSLIQSLNTKDLLDVDYNILKDMPNEIIPFFLDLIRLSNIDGEVHITEKMYIKQVGKVLDFNSGEIDELIGSTINC